MITVEVAPVDGRRRRCAGRKVQSRLEGTISISQKHRYAWVRISIGYGQILNRIAIEVIHDNGIGRSAHGEIDRRLDRPVAITEQHRDIVGSAVGHCQILIAILVEVADNDRYGIRAGAERLRANKETGGQGRRDSCTPGTHAGPEIEPWLRPSVSFNCCPDPSSNDQ